MNKYFTEELTETANVLMKRCSKSLATRGMQIETKMRYHYIDLRIAKIKNSDNIKYW